ncbi:hypothetical protein [Flavihumibacter petaseus]|nr:hypothetical protein [Flavihumibacter petaseus]
MKINLFHSRNMAIMLFCGTLAFTACSKSGSEAQSKEIPEENRAMLESDAEAELLYDDVFNNVMGVNSSVAIGGTGVFAERKSDPNAREIPCFTLSWEFLNQNDSFPVVVTIDFGTGCEGWDGRVRKGKVITTYEAPLWQAGAVAETTFDGYFVNDIGVAGTHRIENLSTATQLAFRTKVISGKLTRPNGNYVTWDRTRVITQAEGWGTPWNPADDIYHIVGNGSGAVHRGDKVNEWTTTNIEPLEKRFSCRWISKGKQAIQRNQGPQGILDFGNGDCDDKATITVNGVSVEITLK